MKVKSGVNMGDLKIYNRALILRELKKERMSRKEIADAIKLTPAAVTILVNEMIEEGVVKETGQIEKTTRVGRKRVYIEMNKDFKYVIGINIEAYCISFCLSNLKMECIEYIEKDNTEMSIEGVINEIIETCKTLLWNNNLTKKDILGIGIGIVGIVDSVKGISKRAYGLWEEEVRIVEILTEALEIPVIVENNVRALALAEGELSIHKDINNIIFIKYGPGIGSAIILNNEIYNGSYNNAGELGHMVIDINGELCKCGQRGCLETVASIRTIKNNISKEFSRTKTPILFELAEGKVQSINDRTIIEAYKSQEKVVVRIVENALKYFSVGLLNLIRLWDPNKIIIYSEFLKEKELLNKITSETSKITVLKDITNKIEMSSLGSNKSIGGVILAINELFFKKGGKG